MAEAFLTEEQSLKTNCFRLVQEFLCNITLCEIPEVVTAHKFIRQRQQFGFVKTIRGHGRYRQTCHINGTYASNHVIQYITLCSQYTISLDVDLYRSAGQFFYSFLESGSYLSYNRV